MDKVKTPRSYRKFVQSQVTSDELINAQWLSPERYMVNTLHKCKGENPLDSFLCGESNSIYCSLGNMRKFRKQYLRPNWHRGVLQNLVFKED